MKSTATTVEQYLAELPEDRRAAISAIRSVILENLPDGYAEGMQYGMIGYFVPHSVYPAGYHCNPKQPLPFASLASQKNHMALYMFCLYSDPRELARFQRAWVRAGKKLDMGKGCVRFRKLDDVPLEVIGEAIRRAPVQKFITLYEKSLADTRARRKSAKKKTNSKSTVKATKKIGRKTAAKPAGKITKKVTSKKTTRKRGTRKSSSA
ncbi:MAG: DUF1801 domain-containing protein [Planctomycetota bacterium]|nr:MAG: DUF1801 domain-containing protein [Planctomycetota bacterium]